MKKVLILIYFCSFIIVNAQNQITWSSTLDIASSSYGNNRPRIVTNALGDPLVIWRNTEKVVFSRWNGTGFTTPIPLNPDTISITGADYMGPDIAAHGDTIYVVYKQTPVTSDSSQIWSVYSYDGGLTFSAPVRVDSISDSITRYPSVTTDDLGNPIIAFMKTDQSYANANWAIAVSKDFGRTFSSDVLASGWSSPVSEACECCPGAITSYGNTIAVLYRDNNSNIRDIWAGISTNSGNFFSGGIDIDQLKWSLMACPATGPDGVIIGDTLYSTYMSGASGKGLIYYNKSSLSAMTGSAGTLLTGDISGLVKQNFPRIANSGNAFAIVWTQSVNGNNQLPVSFTKNIDGGFPSIYDTIALINATNPDVAVTGKNVLVVWQDNISGTVKFRYGTHTIPANIPENISEETCSIYPNPSDNMWIITGNFISSFVKIELFNALGFLTYSDIITKSNEPFSYEIDNTTLKSGFYLLKISDNKYYRSFKLIKD